MATEDERYKVPLFDGTNYDNWKFRMEILLDEKELLAVAQFPRELEDESTNGATARTRNQEIIRKDKRCKSLIIQKIADSHLEYCKGKETAHEVWIYLQETFERKSMASQLRIRKALLTLKFDAAADMMESHFLKFDRMVRELKSTGAAAEENDIICHLLLTMPQEYDMIVTAIETMAGKTDLSLSFVKNRLLDEESKRQAKGRSKSKGEHVQSSTAFSSHSPCRGGRKGRSGLRNTGRGSSGAVIEQANTKKFQLECYNCHGIGHKRADCKKPQQSYKPLVNKAYMTGTEEKENKKGTEISFAVCNSEEWLEERNTEICCSVSNKEDEKIIWYLDSGATDHLVNSDKYVENIKILERPIKIKVAKCEQYLIAERKGDISMNCFVSGKITRVKVTNVLIVPNLEFNLISVSRLEMNGFKIVIENGKATIMLENRKIAVAVRQVKLYKLSAFIANESECACLSTKIDAYLWHKRLGHISKNNLKELSKLVDGLDINPVDLNWESCEICVEGKQTKLPHKQERVRAKRPLQLVHSDLMGPITPESHDDKRYILTFIDDFTHFTAVYLLKTKSEVFHFFKVFEAMATAHFNLRMSRFRCDNGREYLSTEMKDYFKKQGIQYELTIRYTPEQNGVAERMNRTILEKGRCMLLGSGLPKYLWTEAVLAAVYVINRTPTNALYNSIPAEKWFGTKQDVSKIKVFGCLAYVRIPTELIEGKFDSRSEKCYMIGYCTNGYRFWNPKREKIITGRDVKFVETNFINSKTLDDYLEADTRDSAQLKNTQDRGGEIQDEGNNEADEDAEIIAENSTIEDTPDQHPRRSTRVKTKPKYLDDYCAFALNAESFVEDVPRSFEEIHVREDKRKWYKAVKDELQALEENKTWTLMQLPPGRKAIDNKWVFKLKYDEDGNIERYKARLVVKGCAQRKGFDYNETYAPVARLTTVRTMLAVINHKNLSANQLDVKNAFLHGNLQEEIYIKPPEGFTEKEGFVYKLNKALYGLKQAPHEWNIKFHEFMSRLKFSQSAYDKCLYKRKEKDNLAYILLYVDDIIVAAKDQHEINAIKNALMTEFKMKDLGGLKCFLGIKICQTNKGMILSQETYMKNLLQKFDMKDCKAVRTPMETNPVKDLNGECIVDVKPYKELVGCLMYAMLTTRPDLSAAINFYSRFQSNATEAQWIGLKRILRYIKGTTNFGLFFRKNGKVPLIGFADSDWAGDSDRKSTSGFLFEVHGATVSWTTRKQPTVALSSTEAEYVALASAVTELIWLKGLMCDLDIQIEEPIIIYEDNQSCIHLLDKWEHRRLKHVDVKYNFVRDMYQKGIIDVKYIPSREQKADILTKGLTFELFAKNRSVLGIQAT